MNTDIGRIPALIISVIASLPVFAEQADYGRVELNGLARDTSWPLNPPGATAAMVCSVNGPDDFLSVREGPGLSYPVARRLKRLAVVEVDTRERRGRRVRVLDAHRAFTIQGQTQDYRLKPGVNKR